MGGKHIFHNYGHGGSGVTVAYGCAYILNKSFSVFHDPKKPKEAAVLGSGILGLMAANELAKSGTKITVYCKESPS